MEDASGEGEWELERLLLGEIRPPPFMGMSPDENWIDDDDDDDECMTIFFLVK